MTRDEILREMGLAPLWRLRRPLPASVVETPAAPGEAAAAAPPLPVVESAATLHASAAVVADAASGAREIDDAMPGFDFAESDAPPAEPPSRPASTPAPEPPSGAATPIGVGPERQGRIAALDWDALVSATAECRACGLCRERRQAVFGVGDTQPDWLFVGEGPGEQEDLRGEPFVGPAGQLLDAMLAAISLQRGSRVYIANAVKCRPPGNRTPGPEEIAACRPFLLRQIALLRPKLIVLLGRAAVSSVLDLDSSLGGLRGRVHKLGQIPVVVTYHPAYLLRTLPEKAKAWEDLCLARRVMRGQGAGASGN